MLLSQMKNNMLLYEIKLTLLQKLMPLMKTQEANNLMKTFDEVLDYPADQSIFRMNINPLRVGLLLYKTISDIHNMFGYSLYCTTLMQDKIINQIL